MTMNNFEASGNLQDWPKNVPGKPTQVAVFGLFHPKKGRTCEILWTAQFPDLDPAMYWAGKKEVEAVRKGKWQVASRVLWKHELTPEQAVAACERVMGSQVDRALGHIDAGAEPDIGDGPLKPVDYSKAKGMYVEIEDSDGKDAVPPFFVRLDEESTQRRGGAENK
jgi:hypothetical protein